MGLLPTRTPAPKARRHPPELRLIIGPVAGRPEAATAVFPYIRAVMDRCIRMRRLTRSDGPHDGFELPVAQAASPGACVAAMSWLIRAIISANSRHASGACCAYFTTRSVLTLDAYGSVDAEAARALPSEYVGGIELVGESLATEVASERWGWWITGLMDRPAFERVAVLPLESVTNDAEMAYFLDGVHVDLTRELMKAGVRVINPTSMQRYRDTDLPIGEIARELSVDAIIQGTASLQDEAVSLDLFMTDGSNDEIVWNASFGSGMRDLLSLYGDIVRGVAAAAGFELSAESDALMAAAPPVNPQVQEFLWWARFHRSKLTRTGLDLALDYYQRVLDLDPQNAQALAGVSGVWGSRAQMGFISAAEARTRGDSAFAAALASDSLDAEVQYALATSRTWRDWEFEVGRQSFVRALEADPTNSLLRALYSQLLYYLDRDQEAREQIEIAVQSDPLSAQIRTYYGMDLVYERDWARADSVLTAVIRDEPNYRMAVTTLRTLYHMTGERERALDMWRRSNAGDAEVLVALGEGAEPEGYSGALRAVAEIFIARSDTMHITPWQIGTLYTRSGDYDLAIEYLERAFEERDQNIPYLSVDPIFDPMRDTPRFRALVERLGLPG